MHNRVALKEINDEYNESSPQVRLQVIRCRINFASLSQKPHVLPLCCLSYSSLTEVQTRAHLNKVVSEMNKRKMKVAGK